MLKETWEFFVSNLKDIFYVIGILSAIIVGGVNIKLALKNRKNVLREHLYKEQLVFIAKLNSNLSELQSLLLHYTPSHEEELNIMKVIDETYKILFGYSHIAADSIMRDASAFLTVVTEHLETQKNNENRTGYEKFEQAYLSVTSTLRHEVGLKSLSKENENLIKKI